MAQPLPETVSVQKLARKHPEFQMFEESYAAVQLLFNGGVELQNAVARANLFLEKAPKELPEVYAFRQKRLSYTNLIGSIIGWYISALFKDAPNFLKAPAGAAADQPVNLPKEVEDFCARFENDADRGGTSLVMLLQRIAEMCLLHRRSWVLIDLPAPDGSQPVSLKDQTDRGLLDPFLMVYAPSNVINWKTDAYGNLEWALIYFRDSEQSFAADQRTMDYWYYFDREQCALYEREVKQEIVQTSGVMGGAGSPLTNPEVTGDELARMAAGYPKRHALAVQGKVPLFVFELPRGLWLANRVYLPLINHLNQDNALDFGLFQANLPQLCIEDGDNASYEEPKDITISAVGYHSIPHGGKMYYLEPEGGSFETSQKRIDSLEERIYKACYLMDQARTNRATPAQQSGISKQLDKTPSRDAMSGIGDVLRPGVQEIYQTVLSLRGFGKFEVDVRGFEFADKSTVEDLELLEQASVIDVNSETYERELEKKAVRAVLSDANPQTLAAIDKEIETNPTPTAQAVQQQQQQRALMVQQFGKTFPQASQMTQ